MLSGGKYGLHLDVHIYLMLDHFTLIYNHLNA